MGKPKIFISHSAKDDPGTTCLLNLIRDALSPDFAVLIDMFDIPTGFNWRRVLNTWLGDCHGAVLLLTKRALKSDFVAYEASILRHREEEKNCKVIPVFLDPVSYKSLQRSRLKAAAIDHRQAITLKDHAEIVAEIRKTFMSPLTTQILRETPLEIQALYATSILRKAIDADLARYLAKQLNVDFWEEEDPHRALAVALMGSDLKAAVSTIHQLRSLLKGEVMNLFQIVSESWVDSKSTRAISIASRSEKAKRTIVVNASRTLTAQCYIHRASKKPPTDCWTVAAIDGVIDENVADTLTQKIERGLADAFSVEGTENLKRRLEANETLDIPVFVVLPAIGLDKDILTILRTAFPSVTFFMLAGDDPVTQSVLEDADIKLLQPLLEAGFEKEFHLIYSSAETALKG